VHCVLTQELNNTKIISIVNNVLIVFIEVIVLKVNKKYPKFTAESYIVMQ